MSFHKQVFGLIPDGNRRWAKSQGISTLEGHQKGFDVVRRIFFESLYQADDWDRMVIYAFSTENWKRSPFEIKNLMGLYEKMLTDWEDEFFKKSICFVHAGRKDRIPKTLKTLIEDLESKTKNHKNFQITLCLDYGGQDEIKRAVNLDPQNFASKLQVPEIDFVVRTSGEQRISNFCLWQLAYAEILFFPKFLPSITQKDFQKILQNFKTRNRRKGGD